MAGADQIIGARIGGHGPGQQDLLGIDGAKLDIEIGDRSLKAEPRRAQGGLLLFGIRRSGAHAVADPAPKVQLIIETNTEEELVRDYGLASSDRSSG